MRRLVRAAVIAVAGCGALAAGTGFAAATEGPLPTDVVVAFHRSAPAAGAAVRDVVTLRGTAEALEGVRAIEFYVLADRPTGTAPTGRPLATAVFEMPRTPAAFTFDWDPGTRARVVDLVVVARTATRSGRAEIADVRVTPAAVTRPAPAAAPAPRPAPRPGDSRGPAARPVAAPARAAAPAALAAPRPAPRPQRPAEPEISQEQATAFYSVFGRLPFRAQDQVGAEPVRPRRSAVAADAAPRRTPWLAFGLGTMLLAAAVQALRMARPPQEAWAVAR